MKILDRYISSSVAAAFISGVTIFMVLLCAMSLFKNLIELINEHGVAPGMAVSIFLYKIPGMLVYAFPMAMLLGILIVFSRMSSESEMVSIRAAGVSFTRITLPAMLIALLVTGLTYAISNYFAPYASKRSAELEEIALRQAKVDAVTFTQEDPDGRMRYSIQALRLKLDGKDAVMENVSITYFENGTPSLFVHAPKAVWNWQPSGGYWRLEGFSLTPLHRDARQMSIEAGEKGTLNLLSPAFRLTVSPFRLRHDKKDPTDMTSQDIRRMVAEMRREGASARDLGEMLTRLAQRYATPFACLVFALIGAPLGLRHHRTSSAVGFGMSLLVIFAFYFVNVYVTSFGDSGVISPVVAAWVPNVLGAILGVTLIVKANR